jgi:hypothetical protein
MNIHNMCCIYAYNYVRYVCVHVRIMRALYIRIYMMQEYTHICVYVCVCVCGSVKDSTDSVSNIRRTSVTK